MSVTNAPTTSEAAPAKTYTFGFTDRASYLAYRKAWREEYATTSAEARALKTVRTRLAKDGEYAGSQQAKLVMVKAKATEMLAERAASKVEAERQYTMRRSAEQFAAKLAAA